MGGVPGSAGGVAGGTRRKRGRGDEGDDQEMEQADGDVDMATIEGINKIIGDFGGVAVSGVYPPPRVGKEAEAMGLPAGLATGLVTGWGFRTREDRIRARKLVNEQSPWLLTVSPMCGPFSRLPRRALAKRDPGDARRMNIEAEVHAALVAQLYNDQNRRGQYFLHAHPGSATPWKMKVIQELAGQPGCSELLAMCAGSVWG